MPSILQMEFNPGSPPNCFVASIMKDFLYKTPRLRNPLGASLRDYTKTQATKIQAIEVPPTARS